MIRESKGPEQIFQRVHYEVIIKPTSVNGYYGLPFSDFLKPGVSWGSSEGWSGWVKLGPFIRGDTNYNPLS